MTGLPATAGGRTGVKAVQMGLIATAELLAMAPWFSASAVLPQLDAIWHLSTAQQPAFISAVQLGFVAGALLSALANLPDRLPPGRLFAAASFGTAAANLLIILNAGSLWAVLACRFLTGVFMAGVYPPAMKLICTWCRRDRGWGIGLLIGANCIGTAMPHLLRALPAADGGPLGWRGGGHRRNQYPGRHRRSGGLDRDPQRTP